MAEDMRKAKEVFDTLIRMLDNRGWHYEKDEDRLLIASGVRSEDLPIQFIVVVNPQQQVVQFLSRLPFKVAEDKRIDAAIAACVVNYRLCDGSFDYDIEDGSITFRLTSSYRESTLGEDLFEYMIMVSAKTVDRFNDNFYRLSEGMMTLQQLIEEVNS